MKIKIIAIALIVITIGILLYLVTNFTDIFLTEKPEDINNAEVIIVEDKKEETNKPNPTDTSKIAYFGGYGKKSSYSNCEQRDFLISLDRNTKKITDKDAELIAEKVQKDVLKEFKAVNGEIQTINIEGAMHIQVENGNRGYMVKGTVNGLPFLTMYSLVPLDGKELSDAATPDIMETFPLDKQELFKTIENWYGIAGIAYIQTSDELPIIDILWSSMSKYDE